MGIETLHEKRLNFFWCFWHFSEFVRTKLWRENYHFLGKSFALRIRRSLNSFSYSFCVTFMKILSLFSLSVVIVFWNNYVASINEVILRKEVRPQQPIYWTTFEKIIGRHLCTLKGYKSKFNITLIQHLLRKHSKKMSMVIGGCKELTKLSHLLKA